MLGDPEGIKYVDLHGPIDRSSFRLGYGSHVKGFVKLGKKVRIGDGTYIISEDSKVIIGDDVIIGDNNVIKERDYLPENKSLDIIIGEGTELYNNIVLGNGIKIGKNCKISDFVKFGRNISVEDNCTFEQYANIAKNVAMGSKNKFYACTIGSAPQEGSEDQHEDTVVIIGDDNLFREYVIVNRGSEGGGGKTIIGSHNKIFSQSHIAHDCILGDYNEFISFAALAGHVHVGNYVRISGQAGIGQFVNIGDYSFIAGQAGVTRSVLPYSIVGGNPALFKSVNRERLKRVHGEGYAEVLAQVRETFKIVRDESISDKDLVERLRKLNTGPAKEVVNFILTLPEKNKKIIRFRRKNLEETLE
ncbi:hypothetical protein GOV06_05730 [Candidatus Woesearchaeota archaeon]|nr:hypothetical protein [Candidatus Woesearchaeota archaeon]